MVRVVARLDVEHRRPEHDDDKPDRDGRVEPEARADVRQATHREIAMLQEQRPDPQPRLEIDAEGGEDRNVDDDRRQEVGPDVT